MFNFTIFTKALTDTTLSKNEFRVLCLFLNTSSFKQSNTFEMYNGLIQDTLGISERNVRDITKSLELKDYIKKEVNTNSHNRNANTYTIINTQKCAENCAENCPPNNLDIKNNKNNNNLSTIELKDLGPIVIEDKKEKVIEMKTSTSEDQNKNEVKVNSPKVRPSSKIEDNNTGGKAYIPKNFEVNSPTSHSEDDMSFDEYTEYDLKQRGLTSNKATGDVETRSMEQLPTNDIKTQPDAKEVVQTEREAKIASIMTNIELDKDGMLKAKNQTQFDTSLADFKHNLSNLKHLVSDEAYNNYRSTQVNWWNATVKYLVWYKDPNKKPTKPTVEQMGNYQYHLDSMRIAQKIEDMENALNRMSVWFDKMEALYTKAVMQQYWHKFESDCASVKRSNPIFEEWQRKINQTA